MRSNVGQAVWHVEHAEQRDQDWELSQQGETPPERVHPVLAVQPHRLLVHLLPRRGVSFPFVLPLDLLHLRLDGLHRLHRPDLLDPQREQEDADPQRQQDDVRPVVRHVPVEEGEDGPNAVEQRLEGGGERVRGEQDRHPHAPAPSPCGTRLGGPNCGCMTLSYLGRVGA